MFICENCGRVTNSREKMTRKVVETREKEYPNGGKGFETVREIALCENCAPSVSIAEKKRHAWFAKN